MKQWSLIRSFYQHMRLPSILIALIMTVSLLALGYGLGRYRYQTYAQHQLLQSGLENSFYVMHFGPDRPGETDMEKEIQAAQNARGVETVLYDYTVNPISYDNNEISLRLLPQQTMNALPIGLESGGQFSKNGLNKDGTVQVVIGSQIFKDVNVGQHLSFKTNKGTSILNTFVVGKLRYPYFHSDFSSAGDISACNFIFPIQIFIAKETPETLQILKKIPNISFSISTNYFVKFSANASKADIAAYLTEAKKDHYVLSYDDLVKSTAKEVNKNLSVGLSLPLFLLFLATVALLSVAILFAYKKANENAIWYLCGCSKKRCRLTMFAALGILGTAAAIVNIALILLYPVLGEREFLTIDRFYVDNLTILPVLGYLLLTLLIVFAVSFLFQRKASPIESLRRLDE